MPKLLIDPYDRPARLYPALLAFLPVPVLLVCLYGKTHSVASSVVAVLSFCGAGYALSRVARDAGKRLQDSLFAKWNGAPTTQLLRHSDPRLDMHTKERFHAFLSKSLGKAMPTWDAEHADSAAADEMYRAATVWLIGRTRDSKAFPLVFKENVAFGFQRNCLGLRRLGIVISTLCLVVALLKTKVLMMASPYFSTAALTTIDLGTSITLALSTMMLVTWSLLMDEGAARRTAFAYAERLLESCDQLERPSKRSSYSRKG